MTALVQKLAAHAGAVTGCRGDAYSFMRPYQAETFRLILASPINGKIGFTDRSTVLIDDSEDKQVIEFETWRNVEVVEPKDAPLVVEIKIV